ncbi:hypothetical protein DBA29_19665 [Xenophilus aerolatus]|nr:hypothetical protein [Xenophilus aerolatus]
MPYHPKGGVCDCTEAPLLEEQAIILFPNLGSPLLLAPGQQKASIFIAAPSSMRAKVAGQPLREEAVNMYRLVDQHMRVTGIDDKKEANQADGCTETGTLFGDGKACAQAKAHIKGWRVGEFGPGALISDRHGRPFATVAPAAAQIYTSVQDVYEIELDLSAPPFADLQAPGSMSNLAWMVRLSKADRELEGFRDVKYAEPQDLAIVRFLQKQKKRDPWHFDKFYEFKIPEPGSAFSWASPGQQRNIRTLLKSWHPVKRMGQPVLKLGHLSDVHVSARHNALAQSPAKVLEDADAAQAPWNKAVGGKVCNAFESLKALFEKMAGQEGGSERVDAVLLTGDLIDYNRNANPAQFMSSVSNNTRVGIGEQWKKFNLLANVFDPVKGKDLYPRGLDDMLVFSLVREMYRKHKLPVIMTSGNHEAYQVPYGISARVEAGDMGNWAFKLGVLEAAADGRKLSDTVGGPLDTVLKGTVPGILTGGGLRAWGENALPEHKKQLEAASAWTRGKANEGMSRDHNMTIYEACLAYGPTYGQALTGYNFDGGQFDWFYALFTPLADVVYAYGADSSQAGGAGASQVIAALGWGVDENFKNLWDSKALSKIGADRQGAGILPRATESFSADQLKLVTQARRYKQNGSNASLTVASHFTVISFDEPQAYSLVTKAPDQARLYPSDSASGAPGALPAFNHLNVGTCERNQKTYLEEHTCIPGLGVVASPVDWHLSGHSHRSGVYTLRWGQPRQVAVASSGRPVYAGRPLDVIGAKDPGIHGAQTVPKDKTTAFVVVSAGGGIGYQNLDGELSAWTGRAPAGNLLEPARGRITQVKTERSHVEDGKGFNERPRLCVALDYLHVMSGIEDKGGEGPEGRIAPPLRFKPGYFARTGEVELVLSEQVSKLGCLGDIALWVFEVAGEKNSTRGAGAIKHWHRLTPARDGSKLKFSDADRATLARLMNASNARAGTEPVLVWSPKSMIDTHPHTAHVTLSRRLPQVFCEVALKAPAATAAGEDWGKDMLYDKDPWVFPLDIALIDGNVDLGGWSMDKSDAAHPTQAVWHFGRPAKERGEVPDWDWLQVTWGDTPTKTGNKYPKAKEVIRPYG